MKNQTKNFWFKWNRELSRWSILVRSDQRHHGATRGYKWGLDVLESST